MDFLYLALIWLSSLALGRVFLKIIKIDFDKNLINLISISMGWAILSFYVILLIWLHLLYKDVVLYSLIIFSIVGLYQIKSLLVFPSININFKFNKFNILLITLIVYLSISNLFDVFSPPSVADSLVYHFNIPLKYIEENSFFYNPFFHYNAPHLLEIFSIIGFIFNSESLVHLQYYSFNFLILWILISLSKKYFEKANIGILAFSMYFVTPMVTDIKSAGYVEVGLSVVTIISIWMLFESLKQKDINKNYFILSAIFLGIALSIKYYGLFTLVITFFMVTFHLFKNKINLQEGLKYIYIYSAFVILFGGFFYILNYVHTGNPLYPALFSVFGGQDYSLELNSLMKEMINANKRPAGEDLWGFVMSLWNLTMDGERFLSGRNGYGPILLILPLFLLPFTSLVPKDAKKLVLFLTVYVVLFWILWYLFAIQRGRHFLPFFILLTFLISIKICDIKSNDYFKNKLLKRTTNLFLFLFFSFGLAVHLLFTKQFMMVSIGEIDREAYLEKKLPHYKAIQWVNKNLPKDAYVYNLISYREYYLKRKSFYPSIYFQGWYDFTKIKNVDDFYEKLKKDGFTHIILQPEPTNTLNTKDKFNKHYYDLLNEVVNKFCTKLKVIKHKSQITRTGSPLKEYWTYVYVIN
jgi:hypothetical protein